MKKKYSSLFLSAALFCLIISCATKPILLSKDAGPLDRLPPGEDFYLLARPAGHEELNFEILKTLMPLEHGESFRALERTREAALGGKFTSPPVFAGLLEGEYPPFFVRRALKRSPDWHKTEGQTWQGPGGILADTLYKNTLIAASLPTSLEVLRQNMNSPVKEGPSLPEAGRLWWEGGIPVLLLYLPRLERLPLPAGLKAIPSGSSALLGLESSPGQPGIYSLRGELRFSDPREARLWALGLRFFLAARLGLSSRGEERKALGQLNIEAEGPVLKITDWSMSPGAWGEFLGSFR